MSKFIKAKLLDIGKKHHWFLSLLRKVRFAIGRLRYMYFYRKNHIDDKMVVFESYMGRQFVCSPRAIYLQMLSDKRFDDFTFVWVFKNPEKFRYLEKNKNTVVVGYTDKKCLEYYSKAKFWVTNSRLKEIIRKKDGQVYIQCWHGTPLKKLGYDIQVDGGNAMNSINDIRNKYSVDSARYTYMIAPSEFAAEKFASAFNLSNLNILQTLGYPRNDFLYNYSPDDVERVKEKLQLDPNKKVILYAPTWRDNQHEAGKGYTYKLNIDFERLKKRFGEEYIILFRTHYFVSNHISLDQYKGFVYNVSDYDDINDLYIVSDVLITDYSSVFFDFANLNRPILFYMYDFENYKNHLRDFYIDLSELPGPIVQTEDELMEQIELLDSYDEKYGEIYQSFNDKFNYMEDGHSSARVIERCIVHSEKDEAEYNAVMMERKDEKAAL